MDTKTIKNLWEIIFIIGFGLLIFNLLRYLNLFLTGLIPWSSNHTDYFVFSSFYFIFQLILLFLGILIFKRRKKSIYSSTSFIGLILWISLSHQHDIYIFIIIPFISLISYLYFLIDKFKQRKT